MFWFFQTYDLGQFDVGLLQKRERGESAGARPNLVRWFSLKCIRLDGAAIGRGMHRNDSFLPRSLFEFCEAIWVDD